jgi:deoxyribodipyrimidine photolyase-related protein
MSDYCKDCPYDPKSPVAQSACPFTTLYWDFLSRNRHRLKNNPRMGLQFKNLDRKSDADRKKIRRQADRLKDDLTSKTYL